MLFLYLLYALDIEFKPELMAKFRVSMFSCVCTNLIASNVR